MKLLKKIKWIGLIVGIVFVIILMIGFVITLDKLPGINIQDSSGASNITNSLEYPNIEEETQNVMSKTDDEIMKGLTAGLLNSSSAKSSSNVVEQAVKDQLVDITVPTWAWADENDSTNLEKVTKNQTFQVNSFLAKLWTDFFTDLYQNVPDFVIVEYECFKIEDTGEEQKSGHIYGAAFDLNGSTAGNEYGGTPYTKEQWQKLPENHTKYQTIYMDSPMVNIAHQYTLRWGGEFSSHKEGRHFSFIGDYTRADTLQKYGN